MMLDLLSWWSREDGVKRLLRDCALISPVLELEVSKGDDVVCGLHIVGEHFAVRHLFLSESSGVCRAVTD